MKIPFHSSFFTTPTGQLVVVGLVAVLTTLAIGWRKLHPVDKPSTASNAPKAVMLPHIYSRDGAKFVPPTPASAGAIPSVPTVAKPPQPEKPKILPLGLFAAPPPEIRQAGAVAPFGRLIPCETLLTLESNRLDTPVIGLVTEDVWHDGVLIVPSGAEVHGRAGLDRTRECLAAQGPWRIVWRTKGGTTQEIQIDGLALDRSPGRDQEGSAGLRGLVLKADDNRDLKLFASTFLSTATLALQETRNAAGLVGETSLVASTARNAALAGTSAVLREYAQQLREAIARDGFYLRVPAGKAFYLYVTQPLVAPRHEN
jgi:hypothetical protein